MLLGVTTESELAEYVFRKTVPAWAANNNFYIRLHAYDPGASGLPALGEIAYTGYLGVAVSRANGFTVSGTKVSNTSSVTFPICAAGSAVARYFSIATTQVGAGQIIAVGMLAAQYPISVGVAPSFASQVLTGTMGSTNGSSPESIARAVWSAQVPGTYEEGAVGCILGHKALTTSRYMALK